MSKLDEALENLRVHHEIDEEDISFLKVQEELKAMRELHRQEQSRSSQRLAAAKAEWLTTRTALLSLDSLNVPLKEAIKMVDDAKEAGKRIGKKHD